VREEEKIEINLENGRGRCEGTKITKTKILECKRCENNKKGVLLRF
jgi:hypothetical protein